MSQTGRGLLLHLHPPTVPSAALRLPRTWGLGGTALVLFLLLGATGVLLMLAYQPSPEEAYGSVWALRDQISFGRWVRNIHHWSANGMLVVCVLHLLRVFFTGAFLGARSLNWIIGLGLLACVTASIFTGYLLPWDQLAYWAVTISTGMLEYIPAVGPALQQMLRGGEQIGASTLLNFFTLHTSFLPASILVLCGFHFWKVRKARGVLLPPGESGTGGSAPVPTDPHLIVREGTVALGVVAAVLWFSVFVDAPLAAMANPGLSPNPAKAPWYFLGFQELLIHLHPLFAVAVLPGMAMAALVALPYLPYGEDHTGAWFVSPRGKQLAGIVAVAATAVATVAILFDDVVYRGGAAFGSVPGVISGGALPLAALAALLLGFFWILRRWLGASLLEATQTLFVFLFVAFVVCTITGIWFRGPGMALSWPGSIP